MSEHDFSGIDEHSGRWMGPIAGALFVVGSLFAIVLMAAAVGKLLEN